MTIKEVEQRTGLVRSNIRYYEDQGLIFPLRSHNGYRDYSEEDVLHLQKIKLLRQLNFSIDEILNLQKNEISFSEALTEKKQNLDELMTFSKKIMEIYTHLQLDGSDYVSLDAPRYLNHLEEVAKEDPKTYERVKQSTQTDTMPYVSMPWRRSFARGVDLGLYFFVYRIILTFVIKVNPTIRTSLEGLMDAAIIYIIMIFVEPFLLKRYSTTLGKWIFGFYVQQKDGTPLTYDQGLSRTFRVFFYGMGLGLPFIYFWRSIASMQVCFRGDILRWDEDIIYYHKAKKWYRIPIHIAVIACLGIANHFLPMIGAIPPHRGDLTVVEFAENYNYLHRYNRLEAVGGSAHYLTDHGTWQNRYYTLEAMPSGKMQIITPPLAFTTTEGGTIEKISIDVELTGEEEWIPMPTEVLQNLLHAYVSASHSFEIFSSELENAKQSLQYYSGTFNATIADVKMHTHYEIQGFVYEINTLSNGAPVGVVLVRDPAIEETLHRLIVTLESID